MSYDELFYRATGHKPYPYQRRLAESPDLTGLLAVPTGLGKTEAVILAWLWRRRYQSESIRATMPRRLVYCLPARVLVTQTVGRVKAMLDNLGIADIPCITLMGGAIDGGWDETPEADEIIVGTQDQLVSRALNRGFNMSRYRWPMHFAWLNSDVFWVMDETQLMGPTVQTSAQLEAFRSLLNTYGPHYTLWMSATLDHKALQTIDFRAQAMEMPRWTIDGEDLRTPALRQRIEAEKRLTQAMATVGPKPSDIHRLVQEILRNHCPGSLTLVVVNQVVRAQALAKALRESDTKAELLLLHSRYRRADRAQAEKLMGQPVPEMGRIIVATQVVEAGLDLSAHCLFTEIAPWPSMVQRFGRCNREGTDAAASVIWIDIATSKGAELPYTQAELAHSRAILETLHDARVAGLPMEWGASPLNQVLRRVDLLTLFDTAADLTDLDVDVSRYIRDRQALDVSVFWRDFVGDPAGQPGPELGETCPVSLAMVREYMQADKHRRQVYAFRYMEGEWVEVGEGKISPGQTLLLRSQLGGYDPEWGFLPSSLSPVAVSEPRTPDSLEESDGTDSQTHIGRYVTLAEHLHDVQVEAAWLTARFSWQWPSDAIVEAASKHDWGKATEAFQNTLLQCESDSPVLQGQIWAKSRCAFARHRDRPHLRHELASALAALQTGSSDLVAYLVAAHHGKVRMSIRAVPGEKEPGDGRRYARGVWDGDTVQPVAIGEAILPTVHLSLAVMEIGGGGEPSWAERVAQLIKTYGPFRLAVLESMVRIADWRATQKEMEGPDDTH